MRTAVADDQAGSQRWVFAMTVAFLYAADVLRSLLTFDDGLLALALALLLGWLALLLTEPAASRRKPSYFVAYVVLQSAVVAVLLTLSDSSDFFALLLAVPGMQAMQRWRPSRATLLIALYAPLTALCLLGEYGTAQAIALAAIYAGGNALLGAYALAVTRAGEAKSRNAALVTDLREANERLSDQAEKAERLATLRERRRLARDLHDSVTQTLFGMTLTAQSSLLLLKQQPQHVSAQLDQIDQLAGHAVSEMRLLGAELPPSSGGEGLAASLRRHAAERAAQDGLSVSVAVDGQRSLPPDEEAALLHIVQEALDNVVKHAGVSSADVRLRLRRPCRLQIEDRGAGFEPARTESGGVGLAMRRRAAEIGWSLTVTSSPGAGTRVVAEEAGIGEGMASDGT